MTIELEVLVAAGVVIGLVCGLIGYWWAGTNQRRAAGGKSIAELTTEKQQYEDEVVEHFKASADLLNEMTDKYRDVYRHMAEGAQKLVPGENVAPALAALQSGLLAAPGEPPREAVLEPEDNVEQVTPDAPSDVELEEEEMPHPDANAASDGNDDSSSNDDTAENSLTEVPEAESATPEIASGNDEDLSEGKGFFNNEPDTPEVEADNASPAADDDLEKPTQREA